MECFVFNVILIRWMFFGVVYSVAIKDYDIRDLLRRKRSLLFPNPQGSETKVQVLFGLGLPMEGEVSMTLGYVLKCNYDLPYNASILNDERSIRNVRAAGNHIEDLENTRPPLKASGGMSRWSIYRILEMAIDSRGSMGKACLLRAVCEAAETPFLDGRSGLLSQLLHVLLTPSTTNEECELYSDREYNAAEIIGRDSNGEACRSSYPECVYSPLDYFTKRAKTFLS